MDAKDVPPGDSRSRPPSLSLDASKFPPFDPSPPVATLSRPRAMTLAPPPSQPSSSSLARQRSRAATVANPPKAIAPGAPQEKEKRKRSRVTPEQLTHLERIFALDRSPTAAKRKEISEMLGMHERQTQIWFQNRRAKAKTLEGKGKIGLRPSPPSGADSPPDTPPDYSLPLDVDLHHLIHEDEPVTIIPCSDLSIGSWRRISATLGQHDLVAYISPSKRCLTWFILSNAYGFKMEIPFDIITTTNFTSTTPGQGLASFYLARPPLFYLEAISSPTPGRGSVKTWKKCADWTEGQQASKVLRHDLVGAAVPLANALKTLPGAEHLLPMSAPLTYHHTTDPMQQPQPMHIPQPPMAGLEPPRSSPFGLSIDTQALLHGRKRAFSGPAALSQASATHDMADFGLLGSPADTSTPSFSSPFPMRGAMPFTPDYAVFRPFAQSYDTAVPISHVAPRPFSASSTSRFAFDAQTEGTPPLLTAGFDPGQDIVPMATDTANLMDSLGTDEQQATSHETQQSLEAALGMDATPQEQ